MATEIQVPKLSMMMTEAVLAEWLVQDGATVSQGDPLYVLDADKSSQEIEAPASGTVEILAVVGETYEVGHLLARIS